MVDYTLPPGMQTYDNLIYWANPILADIDARLGLAATVTYVDAAIATEVSSRNTAIGAAIATEVTNRNTAITAAVAAEATARIADVDAEEAARIAADNLRLLLTGGTLSGFLTLHAAPTADMHAATKKYVDDQVGGIGGYTDEMARDAIGAALVAGTGMTVTPNDGADTITLATTITQYTDEMARDAIGAALVAGTGMAIVVNDAGDTITLTATVTAAQNAFLRAGRCSFMGGMR